MMPMSQDCATARIGTLQAGAARARCGRWAAAVLVLIIWLPGARAQGADGGENLADRVKAAFIFKFANYVEWPADTFSAADAPIRIAVMGADPLAAELATMVVGRTVQGRPLAIRRMAAGESIAGVHVIFIGAAQAPGLRRVMEESPTQSTLVVTDFQGALELGSMINFVLVERRLKFEIALDTAEKRRLKLSSRLLAVALGVRRGAP